MSTTDKPHYLDTDRATAAHLRNSAHRAAQDPAKLARAARIIRAALARGLVERDDLTPLGPDDVVPSSELRAPAGGEGA